MTPAVSRSLEMFAAGEHFKTGEADRDRSRKMTGRQKIEAAFSKDGTREIPAVICYEGIYIRDHWAQITSYPWWYQQAPDIERQLLWRREVIAKTGQDWFVLPFFNPRENRQNISIDVRPNGIFRVDSATLSAKFKFHTEKIAFLDA